MTEIQPKINESSPNSNLFPNFMESEPLLDHTRINEYIRNLLATFPDACWGKFSITRCCSSSD